MYCNQCGNKLPENGVFCAFCGAKAEGAAPSAPIAPATAAPVSQAAPVQESIPLPESKKKEKIEKYYTTKHIVLCLVVAGIMAAAAGVFAGLYFSVI